MKMLSPLRAGLALSMLGVAVFGCDDGTMSDGGEGAAAGTTGAGASAGSNGVGGTSAAGAAGGTGGAASGGSAGSAAGGSIGNGGAAGAAAGGTGGLGAGGTAGSVGAGGAAGSGGTPNDAPPTVTPGSCKSDLGGYQTGWVTMYWFEQGTDLVNCSYPHLERYNHNTKQGKDRLEYVLTGDGTYFGAMNTHDYDAAAVCGACVEVTRGDQNKKVTITIADRCPIESNTKCTAGHIDLSREAFFQLGTEQEGYLGQAQQGKEDAKGQISWKYVPCPDGETVHFTLKEHDNPNWNEVRVSGNRWEITKVEVLRAGAWVNATRKYYNYWEPDGGGSMGVPPYRVRVTDVNGSVIEAPVKYEAGEQDSGVQFSCN